VEYNTAVEMVVRVQDMEKFDEIKKKVESIQLDKVKVNSVSEEDVGFGIKNIKVVFLTVDEEGVMGRIEEAVKNIDPDISFDVTNITRV
jgi:translation elongation factor EF-1beta